MNLHLIKKHNIHIILADIAVILLLVIAFDPVVRDFVFFRPQSVEAVGDFTGVRAFGQVNGYESYFTSSDENNGGLQLNPNDVVLDDENHRLFVSDGGFRNRILVYDLDLDNLLIDHIPDYILGWPDFKTVSGGLSDSLFSSQIGMAFDADGQRLFVADTGNNRVVVFDTSDGVTNGEAAIAVLGQPNLFTGTAGTSATEMDAPGAVDFDDDNQRLFVSDRENNRVLVFDLADGLDDGEEAVGVLGQTDFISGGLATTQDGFYLEGTGGVVPEVLYIESTGQLFVSDYNNARVMVFDLDDGLDDDLSDGEPASNVLGEDVFTTGSGGLTDATNIIFHAMGLAYDGVQEILYVGDDVGRILIFDLSDGIDDGEAAVDLLGQDDFSGQNPWCPDDGNNDHCASGISDPQGLEVDDAHDRLYVATGSGDERVSIFEGANDGNPPPAEPIDAIDNLGQLDGPENPVFETTSEITAEGLSGPEAVALDSVNHRLFVADTANNRILGYELDADNEPLDLVADLSLGQFEHNDYTPSEGPDVCREEFFRSGEGNGSGCASDVNARGLDTPSAVAYDSAGDRLFVADTDNNRILVFVGPFVSGALASYVLGQSDFSSTVDGNAAAELNAPKDVEYDSVNERLFVADAGSSRVVIYELSGGITNGMAATWVLGAADFGVDGDGGLGPDPDTLGQPEGLAYDPTGDRLFVADFFRDRVVIYNLADLVTPGSGLTPQSNVLGHSDGDSDLNFFDEYGPANGQNGLNFTDCFYCVSNLHMAFDTGTNRLYVPDRANNRIMIFDVASITDGEDAVDVIGQPDFDTYDSNLSQNGVYSPQGVAYDSVNDEVYVADTTNNRVMVFAPVPLETFEHIATDVVGQVDGGGLPIFTSSEINNSAVSPNAQGLDGTGYLALDTVQHRLFISDINNNRVLVFNLTADNSLDDHDADFVLGQSDFTANSGATTQSGMSGPNGLAYDAENDRLFVAEMDNNRVLVFDTSAIVNGEPAVNVLGQSDFDTGAGGTSQSQLLEPSGIAYDSTNGRLYVSEYNNNRISVFDARPTGGSIDICSNGTSTSGISDGMPMSCELGQTDSDGPNAGDSDFFNDGDPGLAIDRLNSPDGVTIDESNQRLFVADQQNNRVVEYNLSFGIIDGMEAEHVLGQTGFDAGTGGTSPNQFLFPIAPLYDPGSGYLYVAEYHNNRVTVFDVNSIDDGQDAVDLYGQTTLVEGTNGTSDTKLRNPAGLAYDDIRGALWVSDQNNNRVLVFGPAPSGGGGQPPTQIGFFPDRIDVNSNDKEVQGYNVLVNIHAHFSEDFLGTVDVLLSNVPDFSTTIPFRYNIPDQTARKNWPKTVAWDLCFGLSRDQCDLGEKTVYARFYVNLPTAKPALTPIQTPNSNR